MQRLKGINEVAIIVNPTCSYRRYDHCMGVLLLLRMHGASRKEQVAGLLHDISHTAFSHSIDRVFTDSGSQDYQDITHKSFIKNSIIPSILKKYGMDINDVTNLDWYTLLETKLPDICADRIDYALRNFEHWENKNAVKPCVEGLINYGGSFVFKSIGPARIFAKNYLNCQMRSWSDVKYNLREHLFSKVLRIALEKGIITMDDMYSSDDEVMKKLRESNNESIRLIFKILNEGVRFKEVDKKPDLIIKAKLRYTDPLFRKGGDIKRLSYYDKSFKKTLTKYLKSRRSHKIKLLYTDKILEKIL
jgi:uncharacterized protein